jgi:molecular chaperone HscB
MNYYELFGIPISLNIDRAILSKRYFELQKSFHPDYFTMADAEEQEAALEKTAMLNKAFKIFKDPDATIKYLLQLKGLLTEEEKYPLPPDFLMEVMELNENLDEGSANEIATLEHQIYEPVIEIIAGYNDAKIEHQQLLQLKEYYFKKKYLQRILDRIDG